VNDDATIVAGLEGLGPELDRLEPSLADRERIAEGIAGRTRYLLLNHRLARRLVTAHREWIADVRAELDPTD
jgi:hypothetical protein